MTASWIVALMSVFLGCSSSSDGGDQPDEFDAQVICEDFVTDRLEVPSSAEFLDQHAFSPTANSWRVSGLVRALDRTGSKVRLTFKCTLEYLGDDEWRARKVAVQD